MFTDFTEFKLNLIFGSKQGKNFKVLSAHRHRNLLGGIISWWHVRVNGRSGCKYKGHWVKSKNSGVLHLSRKAREHEHGWWVGILLIFCPILLLKNLILTTNFVCLSMWWYCGCCHSSSSGGTGLSSLQMRLQHSCSLQTR